MAEGVLWTVGLLCLAVYVLARILAETGSRRELEKFEALRAAAPARVLPADRSHDRSLWSPARIRAYRESLKKKAAAPLAVLRVPKVGIEVPVLEGTDDWTLNRGVGHIEGTAAPDGAGNCGIAGHRDGFFRALKDVAAGDTLELATLGETATYRIESIRIVAPEEVSVLDPTPMPSVTLVTCYPFYFVGSAPQRYVVRAVRLPSEQSR